jgi:dihydrofolate synthase/folylpolyglutamate synthase
MTGLRSLQRLESLSLRGMKLGLAAIDELCARLERPERRVPSILVAGTNGKGSTAATLSSMAAASGLRAGLYTSPHLIRVHERLRVEERDLTDEELDAALDRVFAAADAAPEVPATYFEALTAAAFSVFADRKLDLAVLEVGLGGRFDATNVAPAELSLVTSIGLDHTEELGPTLAAIAREKAGIFRPGKPALARATSAEALQTLQAASENAGAAWHDASAEIELSNLQTSLEGTRFTLATPHRRIAVASPLPGRHQAWNAALAVRACELLPGLWPSPSEAELARGVGSVRWPGRLESLSAGSRKVLLDGCHNAEGAGVLADFLRDAGLAGRCPLVFGAMADKPVEEIARLLFPCAPRVVLVTAPSARAATARELAARVGSLHTATETAESLSHALELLLEAGGSEPIIVAGSLYLVGQARQLLLEEGLGRDRR